VSTTPDYEGLLKLLPRLKRFPDATGETSLTPAEATKIRSLGFRAEPGKWNIPFVPFGFVRDSPFEWASQQPPPIGVTQPDWPGRDVEQPWQVSLAEELPDLQRRMLRAVEKAGSRISKRRLQQKFWRASAEEFNAGLSELIHRGFLRREGKLILLAVLRVTRQTEGIRR